MKLFDASEKDLITMHLYKKKLGLPDDDGYVLQDLISFNSN